MSHKNEIALSRISVADLLKALIVATVAGAVGAVLAALAALTGIGEAAAVAPVSVTVFCVVVPFYYWKAQQARLSTENARAARQALRRIEESLAQTQGLVQLGSAGLPFPVAFGGAYALTADSAAVLAREVVVRRPRVVVELGSGASTILVGRLLQQLQAGRVYSLEHDRDWAGVSRAQVSAAGLEEVVEVFDAPLVEHRLDGQIHSWYSIPEEVDRLDKIDLLVVDGPPQRIDPDGLPRYPAMHVFNSKLAGDALIFVDDAKRDAEVEAVRRWLEQFPGWEARWIPTVPGTCLLSRKPLHKD